MRIETFAAWTAEAVINAVWQGMLIVAAAEVVTRLLPGRSAGAKYAVWCGALAVTLLLPLRELFLGSRGPSTALPSPESGADAVAAASSFAFVGGAAPLEISPAAAAGVTALILVLTVIGVLRTARLMASAMRLRRLKSRSKPLPEALSQGLDNVLRSYGSRGVEIRLSDEIGTPSTIGFIHPAILFPSSLLSALSVDDWRRVALHELAHVRRYDDWANLAQRLAERLFFYFPAIGWAGRRMDLAREMACDEFVVSVETGRVSYAECLTRVAVGMRHARNALAMGATAGASQLLLRVESLVGCEVPARNSALRIASVSLALALFGAGLELVPGVTVSRTLQSLTPAMVTVVADVSADAPVAPVMANAAAHVVRGSVSSPAAANELPAAEPRAKLPAAEISRVATVCIGCDGGLPNPDPVRIEDSRPREFRGRLEPLPPLATSDRSGGSPARLSLGIRGSNAMHPRSAAEALRDSRGFQTPARPGWLRLEVRAPAVGPLGSPMARW